MGACENFFDTESCYTKKHSPVHSSWNIQYTQNSAIFFKNLKKKIHWLPQLPKIMVDDWVYKWYNKLIMVSVLVNKTRPQAINRQSWTLKGTTTTNCICMPFFGAKNHLRTKPGNFDIKYPGNFENYNQHGFWDQFLCS